MLKNVTMTDRCGGASALRAAITLDGVGGWSIG